MKKSQHKVFIGDRLQQYLKENEISIYRLERSCKFANGYFKNVKFCLPIDRINCICRVLPRLNRKWLLSGEGEMLNPEIDRFSVDEPIGPHSIIPLTKDTVDRLCEAFPQINRECLVSGNGEILNPSFRIAVHLEGVFVSDIQAPSQEEAILKTKDMISNMSPEELLQHIELKETNSWCIS